MLFSALYLTRWYAEQKLVIDLFCVCRLGTGAEHLDDDVWEILKPADFFEFAIPFEMSGDTEV